MFNRFKYCIFLITGSLFIASAGAQNLTALDIIRKADDKSRGQTSQGEMTMTIERPGWTRSVTLKSWQKGKQYAMILITAPAKDKGQMFLKIKTDMWNWVPSIEKMIKIPPSMMMQSWMGSDFTNDDLVKESSIVTDYTHFLVGTDTVRGQHCYKIDLIPLPDAAVTWGKVVVWITTVGFNQWKTEFYDEDLKLINVMNGDDIRKMGDREIPVKLEMITIDKPGNKTILETKTMVFDKPIDESFFTQQNMKRLSQSTK
ncbi:MAG: outer membrane lipoprotein-sorting protein [Bacteroidales bacterium]|nr:outer membrane lipoprotein-sorting protein [Bacteroidales bacterium]